MKFIVDNINVIFSKLGYQLNYGDSHVLVSIGLSFYVFQAISYLADIYFKITKPETHFGYFALYMSFFPKIMQGPIERAGELLPQFKTKYKFNSGDLLEGFRLLFLGLMQKIVIADRLGLFVDSIHSDLQSYSGLALLLSAYAYSFQIYMDFLGYTNMALGSARLFNINLTQNFNRPFLANSIAEFWRRWHISFSRWILDYIFEPLQMKFRNFGKSGTVSALLITFILAGLWHGANWTFIAFGSIHGICLASSVLFKPYKRRLHQIIKLDKSRLLKILQVFVTFNLVSLAFVFFRSKNMQDAFEIVTSVINVYRELTIDGILLKYRNDAIIVVISFILMGALDYLRSNMCQNLKNDSPDCADRIKYYGKSILYSILAYLVLFYGVESSGFVYFNF